MRIDLSDEEWAVIGPHLPTGERGPKRADNRRLAPRTNTEPRSQHLGRGLRAPEGLNSG